MPQPDALSEADSINTAFDEESHPTLVSQFNYRDLDPDCPECLQMRNRLEATLEGFTAIRYWMRQAHGASAYRARGQAVDLFLANGTKTNEQFAREIGMTKQGVNKLVTELRDYLSRKSGRDIRPQGGRSADARANFKTSCTKSHQRKSKSTSEKSGKQSTPNTTPQPPTLYEQIRRLKAQALAQ